MDIQFQRIYDLIKNDVIRLAYAYTKNLPDSEDITQEVFIKLYENMNKFINETDEKYKDNLQQTNLQTRAPVVKVVTTSEVKMTLTLGEVYDNVANILVIDLNTRWINGIPSVKSFDVSAFLFSTTGTLQLSRKVAEGYQVSDAGSVTYGNEGGNSKWQANAYGTSMNIINGTKKSLELEIGAEYYYFGSGNLNVNATYQHATRDVTLAQSHTYHFSTDGCGGVVNFYNNIGNYYNSNPGVTATKAFTAN